MAGPTVLPTQGTQSDGPLTYTWHQDYTSSDQTPSRYTVTVKAGWQPEQELAGSIAQYIADSADYSSGDIAPVSLTIRCATTSKGLASGTYVRNDGTPPVTWRTYSESGAEC